MRGTLKAESAIFPGRLPAKPASSASASSFWAHWRDPAGRILLVRCVVAFAFLFLMFRLAMVMLITPYRDRSNDGRGAIVAQAGPARRIITDRDGTIFANNLPSQSAFAVPSEIFNKAETAKSLAELFPHLKASALEARFRSKSLYVPIKRHLSEGEIRALEDLGKGGVHFEADEARVYPQGKIAAHILGFTDADGLGIAGIEKGLEARISLRAKAGNAATAKRFAASATASQADDAAALIALSIRLAVQDALEAELARAADEWKAQGAAGIVLDARTGEIAALASWPSFDPNRAGSASDAARSNVAISHLFEMGSTLKPLIYAAAIDNGALQPGQIIDTRAGLQAGNDIIRDEHVFDHPAALDELLAKSSNVGASFAALSVGGPPLVRFLRELGLEGVTDLEVAEKARSRVIEPTRKEDLARLGYGYGPQISLLALASAYGALANDGVRVTPTLLVRNRYEPIPQKRVMKSSTAAVIRDMMRRVVRDGTGQKAAVPGLDILGKTGTAEKVKDGRYDHNSRVSSFGAIFPGYAPRYVLMVLMDEPQGEEGEATASSTAAVIAGRLLARIAPLLGVETRSEEINNPAVTTTASPILPADPSLTLPVPRR